MAGKNYYQKNQNPYMTLEDKHAKCSLYYFNENIERYIKVFMKALPYLTFPKNI